MLYDRKLSYGARCVYSCLSNHIQFGNVVNIGQRRIGELLGMAQETVGLGLKELSDRKHLIIKGEGKSRRAYVLLDKCFLEGQGIVDVVMPGPSGVPRYVSLDHEREGLPPIAESA